MKNAGDGPPFLDERDVHGELRRAVEEIARSVERIDENEALGPGDVFGRHIAFLADDRHARKGLARDARG